MKRKQKHYPPCIGREKSTSTVMVLEDDYFVPITKLKISLLPNFISHTFYSWKIFQIWWLVTSVAELFYSCLTHSFSLLSLLFLISCSYFSIHGSWSLVECRAGGDWRRQFSEISSYKMTTKKTDRSTRIYLLPSAGFCAALGSFQLARPQFHSVALARG